METPTGPAKAPPRPRSRWRKPARRWAVLSAATAATTVTYGVWIMCATVSS